MNGLKRQTSSVKKSMLEIPGQYLKFSNFSEPKIDFHITIARVGTICSVVKKNGKLQRRLTLLGNDGHKYYFDSIPSQFFDLQYRSSQVRP